MDEITVHAFSPPPEGRGLKRAGIDQRPKHC